MKKNLTAMMMPRMLVMTIETIEIPVEEYKELLAIAIIYKEQGLPPLGEDTRPKDWVKLGLSPSTMVEDLDLRGFNKDHWFKGTKHE